MGNKTTAEQVLVQSKVNLAGRVAVVTGANSGIGLETARVLVLAGARVILTARDEKKGAEAVKAINDSLKDKKDIGTTKVMVLDLADFDSIRAFATAFLAEEKALHLLVNNAGIIPGTLQKTKQGFEMQWGTNHLGPCLLTHLLLDLLKKSAPSRILFVSSLMHKSGVIPKEKNFWSEVKAYDMNSIYNSTKLANVLYAAELDRRLEEEAKKAGAAARVTVHSLNPGLIPGTGLAREMGSFFKAMIKMVPVKKTIPQGAATTLYCCVAPPLESKGGAYYDDCAAVQPAAVGRDLATAKRLYEETQVACGLAAAPAAEAKAAEGAAAKAEPAAAAPAAAAEAEKPAAEAEGGGAAEAEAERDEGDD